MLAELFGDHADGTWGQPLRRLTWVDLLVLDDFGLREFTPRAGDDFFELVSERHKTGSMVLISNRAPADWYGLFPNPVIAEGVLDRWATLRTSARSAGQTSLLSGG
jgi:DNA replication protein DnaC